MLDINLCLAFNFLISRWHQSGDQISKELTQINIPYATKLCKKKKNRKNIYMSGIEVTFELYVQCRYLHVLYSKYITSTKYCHTQWISKRPSRFEIHCVRQYLVNFTGLVGIVYITVYDTEPIFTGPRHGKLSLFLQCHFGNENLSKKLW